MRRRQEGGHRTLGGSTFFKRRTVYLAHFCFAFAHLARSNAKIRITRLNCLDERTHVRRRAFGTRYCNDKVHDKHERAARCCSLLHIRHRCSNHRRHTSTQAKAKAAKEKAAYDLCLSNLRGDSRLAWKEDVAARKAARDPRRQIAK